MAASTEKVSNQFKYVKTRFTLSHHTFLNQLAAGLKRKLEETIPGLQLQFGGKKINGSNIDATVKGSVVLPNPEAVDETSNKVRREMDGLKNPADLVSLLK